MKLLVRLAAMVGGTLVYAFAARHLFPSEDADIGSGLLYFGLLIVVSGTWGAWDGYRATTLGRVFVRWAVVAIAIGLELPVQTWLEEGRDTSVLLSDLVYLTPFLAGLVLVPAAIGVAVGSAFSRGGRSPLARRGRPAASDR